MTLSQLRAFVTAVRTGSFTAAALVMQMSQASVSELVRRLEQEHAAPLFLRGRHVLTPTAAGLALLPHADAALAAADAGQRALASVHDLTDGIATFGMFRNADYYLLSDLVVQFHQRHPKVRVRLLGLNSVDVAAAVTAGTLEAGLVVLPVDTAGLTVSVWARDEVVYATTDAARASTPITIEAAASAQLILYDAHVGSRDPTRRQLSERAHSAGFDIQPHIEVQHVEAALKLAARGVGDTIASRAAVASAGAPTNLHTTSLEPALFDTIALVRRAGETLSPATQQIAQIAQETLRRQPQLRIV